MVYSNTNTSSALISYFWNFVAERELINKEEELLLHFFILFYFSPVYVSLQVMEPYHNSASEVVLSLKKNVTKIC